MINTNNPQYQNLLLKSMRKIGNPGQAIMDSGALDAAFGGEEMRKKLQLMRMGNQRDLSERKMEMNQRFFNQDIASKRGLNSYYDDQNQLANVLGGGNVIVSGMMGYNDLQEKRRQAEIMNGIAKKLGV